MLRVVLIAIARLVFRWTSGWYAQDVAILPPTDRVTAGWLDASQGKTPGGHEAG
jgi:hypothetical protein